MSAPAKTSLPVSAPEILASLAQHRVLTSAQIASIHFPGRSRRWARMAMARIAGAGLASFVSCRGAAGAPRRLWYVTEAGARAALEAGLLARLPRLLDERAASGPLRAHTLAVNDVGIAFMAAARERGDEFGPLAWRHEVAHRLGPGRRAPMLIADALISYLRLTETEVVFEQRFCELDRATLPVDRLAAELGSYGKLLGARAKGGEALWRSHYPAFPPVICVLAGADRAALIRRRDTTVAILRRDPDFTDSPKLSIRFCLAEALAERGPFAPIFTDARDPETSVDWLVGWEEKAG